ncbi:Arylmalonate decarboxylase [Nostoc sp. DSM 114161]|jgi:maleate isomerase|uniref:maleate cis-trans isomerase family protein n=1 Tax=Nostoc sp. DSM 114161 TaxID=3440143 RepID=UPI0040456824
MTDALGWRKKFGVLAPSTNTIVEPDFHAMAVPGVTSHMSRIHIRDQDLSSDEKMLRILKEIDNEIFFAVDRIMTAAIDYLIMGMSAETFWGGIEGNRAFIKRLEDYTGLQVATGASACQAAVEAFKLKKIAVITPYQAVADDKLRRFFSDIDVEILRLKGLRCPTAIAIAEVSEDTLRNYLQEIDGDDIDGIVQMGTNLSMLRLADEAERWLKKPVIAINAATWWYALRQNHISDRVYGYGRLLREF